MTAPKVVKEFLQRCIAPLQRHSRRMWAFAGHKDRMRLQEEDLAPEVLSTVLRVLMAILPQEAFGMMVPSCIFARARPIL